MSLSSTLPPSLSTLVSALTTANLASTFSDPAAGPFTVFAPTNAAFSALGAPLRDWLLNARNVNRLALTNTLKFHALSGRVVSSDITPGGVPLTPLILCPTCAPALTAFNNGTAVTIKATTGPVLTTVLVANVQCSNGVVHIVEKVLVPTNQSIPTQNVAAVATAAGLSSLVNALVFTGLDAALTTGDTIFTVFAPTNTAFDAVPAYIATNKTLLTQVLLYHVLSTGRVYKENLPVNADLNATTMNGQSIKIQSSTVAPAGVTIVGNAPGNKAKVVTADVDSTNAVVHVIDTVRAREEAAKARACASCQIPPYPRPLHLSCFPPFLAGAAAFGPAAGADADGFAEHCTGGNAHSAPIQPRRHLGGGVLHHY